MAVGLTAFILSCQTLNIPEIPAAQIPLKAPVTFAQVQPILNARCIACHSCMESPCQFNMQSWEGLRRGAFHQNVYDGSRLSAVAPTRLFEDAQTESEWRAKGFYDLFNGGENSVFVSTLRLSNRLVNRPLVKVKDSMICPESQKQIEKTGYDSNQIAMPYALPAIPAEQQRLLAAWVDEGAPGIPGDRSLDHLATPLKAQAREWETFLNASDLKSRVVGRYLYEHLFIAHLYFKDSPQEFFKLVRSSSACDTGVHIIATRRPNDAPGVKQWFYCFTREISTNVYKNHIPYELSAAKLEWMKNNFYGTKWIAKAYPSFDNKVAGNPLEAYADIPVLARYRFLLENAQYEVMTFIKGPVCNGSFAVNSIQDQFYVFFMNPNSDLMVKSNAYALKMAKDLVLPGTFGSDLSLTKIITGYRDILNYREQASQRLNRTLEKEYPKGLGLNDIWDGGGQNDNAVLTVFRHDDNAKVLKGARGDSSKTAFVLDYSTFERLVYNLVINFDVFDNVSHQLLTRLYMDILRMDAEDTFLAFLPPQERVRLKSDWYQGPLTRLKMQAINEDRFAKIPAKIKFTKGDSKVQFYREILFKRMNAKVRGPMDDINWKDLKEMKTPSPIKTELKKIASIRADATPSAFPTYFPELSFLFVHREDNSTEIFSIIRNREHENLSWVLNESNRLQSNADTLTVLPGQAGAYPNQYFSVEESGLPDMITRILSLKNHGDYELFLTKYGVDRQDPGIWKFYDQSNLDLARREPIEAGALDLSRYAIPDAAKADLQSN